MSQRLLQVFLETSPSGPCVFEVNLLPHKSLICTCPGFASKAACKHVKTVEKRLNDHDGLYPYRFSSDVSDSMLDKAMKDEKLFREVILAHAKVDVI